MENERRDLDVLLASLAERVSELLAEFEPIDSTLITAGEIVNRIIGPAFEGWRPPLPSEVRTFRYIKTAVQSLEDFPVYRAYPDGRVTRQEHGDDELNAGLKALEFLENQVRQGLMSETPDSTAPRVFLAGDVLPMDMVVLNRLGVLYGPAPGWVLSVPGVAIPLPTPDQVEALVEREQNQREAA